jgi:ribosomal protein S18 acetylase RimI-like enzyme
VLVGISTWIVRPLDGEAAVQMRGMATAGASQRRGIGSALIHEGLRRTVAAGYRVVWAHARDSAAGFYARHGFVVLGDGFVTADTQLPHHLMVRRW